jgi:hypothetical protein
MRRRSSTTSPIRSCCCRGREPQRAKELGPRLGQHARMSSDESEAIHETPLRDRASEEI